MIAKGGYDVIIVFFLLSFAGFLFFYQIGLIFLVLGIVSSLFLRDPYRNIAYNKNYLLSPVDGKVIVIQNDFRSHLISHAPVKQIAIYLSIFNVHIVRSPVDGIVKKIEHIKGSFKPANYKGAFIENEKTLIEIETEQGIITLVLTAGIIVRRFISYINENETIKQGQKIGLIRFGSRADIFLPSNFRMLVKIEDSTEGGKSDIALNFQEI